MQLSEATVLIAVGAQNIWEVLRHSVDGAKNIVRAVSIQEALEILGRDQITMVIVDSEDSHVPGFTLFEKIRQDEKYNYILFLLIVPRGVTWISGDKVDQFLSKRNLSPLEILEKVVDMLEEL